MAEGETPPVVVDNGSGTCKAGFAGDDAPRVILPSIVVSPKHRGAVVGIRSKNDYFVGDDAETQRRRCVLQKRYDIDFGHPIENGIVTNWEAMEEVDKFRRKFEFCSVYTELFLMTSFTLPCRFGITLFKTSSV